MMLDLTQAPVIVTPRLRLCLPAGDHLDEFATMMEDEETARFIGGVRNRTDAFRLLAGILGHWALLGFGLFAVEDRNSGAFMGRVGLLRPEGWPAMELAYGLHRPFWGKGYAEEACRAVLKHEVPKFAPGRLVSIIADENLASARLALRLGAQKREPMSFNGTPVTLYEYDLSH
ncbi:MAG: GNAT family N-acetyltransferase [Geminicoccaceae bacterium]|nr:GNAT family N-acetyltransferase [Geminicoccaceae bacterium]MCB9945493.1 GNAT family N-acetyltransferase [Geminicoccaceae bacterium]